MDSAQLKNAFIFLQADKYAWDDLRFEIEYQDVFLTEVAKIFDPDAEVVKLDDLVAPRDDFETYNYDCVVGKICKDIEAEF